MRSVIDKNKVDAIMSQISVMCGLEEIHVGRMGRDEYECRLVNLANQMPGMMEQTPQGDDLFAPWYLFNELYVLFPREREGPIGSEVGQTHVI
jgi:hypothetical protein